MADHLTHGSPVNMSGILYRFVPYSINDEGFLDYDEIRRIAKECPAEDGCVAGRVRLIPVGRFLVGFVCGEVGKGSLERFSS